MSEVQLRELKAKYDYVLKGVEVLSAYLSMFEDVISDLRGELFNARESVAREIDSRLPVNPFYSDGEQAHG